MPGLALQIAYHGNASSVVAAQKQVAAGNAMLQGSATKTAGVFKQALGVAVPLTYVAAAVAAIKFAADSVKVANEHQQTLAQLSLQVGGVTTAYETQAGALERLTGFQHDQVLAADTVLARLKLTQDQITSLVPHILDFAAATGTDVPSAAATFEKALLGTARGLKVGGIAFKDTGDLMGNYNELLKLATNATISGSASLDTFAKAQRQVSAQWKDLEEAAGTALIKVFRPLLPILASTVKLLGKLGPEIVAVGAAFLAFKALAFLPNLLLAIAVRLEGVGAAAASGGFLTAAVGAEALAGALPVVGVSLVAVGGALVAANFIASQSQKEAAALAQKWGDAGMTLGEARAKLDELTKSFGYARTGGGLEAEALKIYIAALEKAGATTDDVSLKTLKLADSHRKAAAAATAQALAELDLAGGLGSLYGDILSAHQATVDLAAAQAKVNRLRDAGKTGTAAYRKAVNDLHSAESTSLNDQIALARAVGELTSKVEDHTVKLPAAIAELKTFAAQGNLTAAETRKLVGMLKDAISQYSRLAGLPDITKHVNTIFQETGGFKHKAPLWGQHGFHGVVTRPTLFGAGEAGAERVDITPNWRKSQGRNGAGRMAVHLNLDRRRFGRAAEQDLASLGW